MSNDKVASLRPFAAVLNVGVELTMISMSAWIGFGPFDTKKDARVWLLALLDAHTVFTDGNPACEQITQCPPTDDETFFVKCSIEETDVNQLHTSFRTKGALIPPKSPADTAGRIHEYALRACGEAIAYTLSMIAPE